MNDLFTEKRKCKRYNVTDFVIAVYANRLGRLINISESGLAIQLIDADLESLPEESKASFFTATKGFLIEELSLKLVQKKIKPSTNYKLQTVGAKFNTSDAIQLCKIKQFISGLS